VVSQEEADRDIPKLLEVPAAVRFLSVEPMLEAIDLTRWLRTTFRDTPDPSVVEMLRIGWVIVGGESDQPGHKARPFNIEWARDIVRQCRAASVSVFVKQLGDNAYKGWSGPGWVESTTLDFKTHGGADPAEWPCDLRLQEFPR